MTRKGESPSFFDEDQINHELPIYNICRNWFIMYLLYKGADIMDTVKRMPVVFTGHGSPMNAVTDNPARRGWIKMGRQLGKPDVIVAVSAHWATNGLFVRRSSTNPQKYDMYGFPDQLYRVHYEPEGSVKNADRVLECLKGRASVSNDWGIDHGIWSVLSNMYPDADVPVVMVSTDISADADSQFQTGKMLSSLSDEGALILCSGNIVHALGLVNWDMTDGYEWADRFDAAVKEAVLAKQFGIPVNYTAVSDHEKAVPTSEHYYPFLTALGAASGKEKITVWNEYRELGSMSMTSYLFE